MKHRLHAGTVYPSIASELSSPRVFLAGFLLLNL